MEEQEPFGNEQAKPATEPAWTFRGYQPKASVFTTAMVHLHRAEVHILSAAQCVHCRGFDPLNAEA